MRFQLTLLMLAVLSLCCIGCDSKKTTTPQEQANAKPTVGQREIQLPSATPQEAVRTFLDATCEGNRFTAELMFSEKTRQILSESGMRVAPQKIASGQYTLGRPRFNASDSRLAQVPCDFLCDTATVDALTGSPEKITMKMDWLVRHESPGWRIYGMATQAENEKIILNFEEMPRVAMQKEQTDKRLESEYRQGGTVATRPGQTSSGIR